MALKTVKGMRDILPPESRVWGEVEAKAKQVFHSFGYEEIRTPVVEPAELFIRSIGEDTDIVQKEMYLFKDKKGRDLVLRPEGTAPVARAFLEHQLHKKPKPLRLFYMGPMFRYEQPQKGRYRQFYQIGAEVLGIEEPLADLEIMEVLMVFLRELSFSSHYLQINSVGCLECRPTYRKALLGFLESHGESLCGDCQRRYQSNPLRVLDCKKESCQGVLKEAPEISGYLCEACRIHEGRVIEGLERKGMDYKKNPRLVRGLDYYMRTVFEVVDPSLGAQNAICGGGRYDRLISDLGGPAVPGIGFALGEDRLIEVLPQRFREEVLKSLRVYLYVFDEEAGEYGDIVAKHLRSQGIPVLTPLAQPKMKKAFLQAESWHCRFMMILGEKEKAEQKVTIKNLETREQSFLSLEEAISWMQKGSER